MEEAQTKTDREAVLKRPSAIEYLNRIRQKSMYSCPNPCQEVIDGKSPCTHCYSTQRVE